MNQNNKKVLTTNTWTLSFLRVFFVLLILLTIIPWVVPMTQVGAFLFGMYGVPHFATQNFDLVVAHFTPFTRFLGFIGSIISVLPLFISTLILMRLSKNYSKGVVFNLYNTKSYRKLGILYLFSALLLQPLSQVFFSLCATLNNPTGQRTISITCDVSNLTAICFAIILIMMGKVMKWGQQLSEEQELTV